MEASSKAKQHQQQGAAMRSVSKQRSKSRSLITRSSSVRIDPVGPMLLEGGAVDLLEARSGGRNGRRSYGESHFINLEGLEDLDALDEFAPGSVSGGEDALGGGMACLEKSARGTAAAWRNGETRREGLRGGAEVDESLVDSALGELDRDSSEAEAEEWALVEERARSKARLEMEALQKRADQARTRRQKQLAREAEEKWRLQGSATRGRG